MNQLQQSALFFTTMGVISVAPLASAIALPLPSINNGDSYGELRKKLLNLGWQPKSPPYPDTSGMVQRFREKGWIEVQTCSGTGLGLCAFSFQDQYGKTLSISTYNNYPDSANTDSERYLIYGWSYNKQ